MNKAVISFLFFTLFLVGCNKITQTEKKIDGDWELISYKLTLGSGMSYYAQGNGELLLKKAVEASTENTYDFQLNGSVNGQTYNSIERGAFTINYTPGFPLMVLNDTINNQTITYRILTLNKTDLQLEGSNSFGQIQTFLFRRKE